MPGIGGFWLFAELRGKGSSFWLDVLSTSTHKNLDGIAKNRVTCTPKVCDLMEKISVHSRSFVVRLGKNTFAPIKQRGTGELFDLSADGKEAMHV